MKNITIIGAGTIGTSWAALFLANGYRVVINDPMVDIEVKVKDNIKIYSEALIKLGYDISNLTQNLYFENDIEKAVKEADFIQENGPENLVWKKELYSKLDNYIKDETIISSSSSGISVTDISEGMKNASKVINGHPFNPPHIIPLVEIIPGKQTSKETINISVEFYKNLGKTPVILNKVVSGFVANRLQAAILRESISLLKEGVADMKTIDTVVSSSIGLRWAVSGPFKTFHLGGGEKGLEDFIPKLGVPMEKVLWPDLATDIHFDDATSALIIEQDRKYYGEDYHALEEERDNKELALIELLKNYK